MIRSVLAACLAGLFATGAAAADPGPFAAFDAASEPAPANPHGLVLGPDGRLYVSDLGNDRMVTN